MRHLEKQLKDKFPWLSDLGAKDMAKEIRRRDKLLTDACLRRTKPVVNLDDESQNCDLCGYDHHFQTEWNEMAYSYHHGRAEAYKKRLERDPREGISGNGPYS